MSKLYGFIRHQIGSYGDNIGNRIERAIQEEQKRALEEIYIAERKDSADQARELFKALCHQGKIRKAEQKALRSLIEDLLGSYAEEYKSKKYDNEFHRLYTYLKSYHLDKDDWNIIIRTLEQIQQSS